MSETRTAAFALLGLPPDATVADVRSAWRRIARETHPDLHPGDPAAVKRFQAAREAYERLTTETSDGPDAPARGQGPDDDWFDACAWMAESHLLRLRREVLPRFAAEARGGPSLARALADAAESGLCGRPGEDALPRPSRWARLWAWYTWRRLVLVIDEGWPRGRGPVALLARDGRLHLVLWPRLLWVEGVREDDAVRAIVQRAVDLGVASAAPMLLDLGAPPPPAPVRPEIDRAWWARRLAMPVVWTAVVVISVVLLVTAFLAGNPGLTLRR